MKKILLFKLLIIFFLCTTCTRQDNKVFYDLNTDDVSLAEVLVKSKLVVGVSTDFPPLSFTDTRGTITGYDIDILTAVADYLDIDVEFVNIDNNNQADVLNQGLVDCLASGFLFDENLEASYEMTNPYLRNALVAVVLQKNKFTSFNSLNGRVIGALEKSKAMEFINKTPSFHHLFKSIRACNTRYDGIRELKIGIIDAFITDIIIVPQLIKGEAGIYTVLKEGLSSDICVFAFKKGAVSLCNAVDSALLDLEKDGTIEKISKKWFNMNVSIIGNYK